MEVRLGFFDRDYKLAASRGRFRRVPHQRQSGQALNAVSLVLE